MSRKYIKDSQWKLAREKFLDIHHEKWTGRNRVHTMEMDAGYTLRMTAGRTRTKLELIRFAAEFNEAEEPELMWCGDVPIWADRIPAWKSVSKGKTESGMTWERIIWQWPHERPQSEPE